jgi:glycosyltransferase involved in cell wall biosynthesis
MKIIVFSHPDFLVSKSMPLFAQMLAMHFRAEKILAPEPFFYRLPCPVRFRKWLGYLDQYLVFPLRVKRALRNLPDDTLFVFADQALGPWVPLVKGRPHVIHVHDLMALRSALGEIPENPTGFTGRIYQRYIRSGFSQGRNFISVSEQTRSELHRYAQMEADESAMVYNGLNYTYAPIEEAERIRILKMAGLPVEARGMLLHVGGAQWYKNRPGVVEMYFAYAASVPDPLPLWMVGPKDQPAVLDLLKHVPASGRVHLLSGLDAASLNAAYAHARLMLFPSLSEGFGWPIAEAMACGTPVLTTAEAPMTEVGGAAAFYHYRRTTVNAIQWAAEGGALIGRILSMNEKERADVIQRGIDHVTRFDSRESLDAYEAVYRRILERAGFPS